MTVRVSRNKFRWFVTLIALLFISMTSFAFQVETITANKNIYKKVVGGGAAGTDFVILDNLTDFSKFGVGDTVLLIQMKGAQILVPEDNNYGTPQDALGSPGMYEFLIVESTNSGTLTVTFTNNLRNTYDVSSNVQLIWVPSYYSAKVNGNITCQPWDSTSGTGGVLTMIVGKTLTLNGNIDVSGKGFIGGIPVIGLGTCTETDPANLNKVYYNVSYNNSGNKGEGVATEAWESPLVQYPILPGYAKGRGANMNGGGGGNGRFSGGGGGSNYGAGGKGGRESNDLCTGPNDGGLGGKQIKFTGLAGGIFMGGGGGGSTSLGGGISTEGGRGGGIVIILCGDLEGNGFSIIADGASPAATATGTGGAGGGGAGGSIAIYLENFSTSPVTLSAKGAKGGNNAGTFGEGGGGGGGFIWLNNITVPGNVTRTVTFGQPGDRSGTKTAGPGQAGESLTSFVPTLNGFLFNTIRSSITNNLTDSICSRNYPYPPIIGTNPVGGSTSYAYQWQRKNDSGGPWTNIASSDVRDYIFAAEESDTFYFRRIVIDKITTLTDTSKWGTFILQPKIQNNVVNIISDVISLTDTVCFNGDPKLIDQKLPDLFVPTTKNLFYRWQDSTQVSTWGAELGNGKSYDPPPGIAITKYFRRRVISGRCADSSAMVRVEVLPVIQNNNISSSQEICHDMPFADLQSAATLTGGAGAGSYSYKWQKSTDNLTWSDATGTITGDTYNPPESATDTETKTYYNRIVYSGNHKACVNSSASLLLTEWKKISNNIITSVDQTICSGSRPDSLLAALPADGNHTYTITWKQRTSPAAGFAASPGPYPGNRKNYWPPQLTDTTWYSRYVSSSFCRDSSNIVAVNVHKPVTNNKIGLDGAFTQSNTTICANLSVAKLFGSDPSGGTNNPVNDIFKWILATSVNTTPAAAPAPSNNQDYLPGTLANADPDNPLFYYYRRVFTSGMCTDTSSTVTVKVLPRISQNTISGNRLVCYNNDTVYLKGSPLRGGDPALVTWKWLVGPSWGQASGTANLQNYDPPPLTSNLSYRRAIFSGPGNTCVDTSASIAMTIKPLPVGTINAGAVTTACEGVTRSFNLQISGSTDSPWTVVYRERSTEKSADITAPPVAAAVSAIQFTPAVTAAAKDSLGITYSLVSITDNYGCKATSMTGSQKLIVYNIPVAGAGADASNCGPVYKLDGSKNIASATGTWSYPGVPVTASTPNGDDLEVTVSLPYTPDPWSYRHRFYYTVLNWNCQSKDSVDITFYLLPDKANAGRDTTIYSMDKEIVLPWVKPLVGKGSWSEISGGASQVDDSTFTSLAVGDNVFEWRVVTTNAVDCYSSDQVIYTMNDLIIPDAFSPNGDMVNDDFEIQGLDLVNSNVTLTILNSAGAEIYRTTNVNDTYTPWNGESKGLTAPDGTYYYLLIIESTRNDSVLKKSGFIVLKRDKLQ